MARKTIIRHTPANPLIGRREISPADFKSLGIFTQTTMLQFDKERNWWLDAEAAKVSKEALQWFTDSPEFTVESQDVPDDEDEESLRHKEAYAASVSRPTSAPQPAVAGENKSESTAPAEASTTTQSTAKR